MQRNALQCNANNACDGMPCYALLCYVMIMSCNVILSYVTSCYVVLCCVLCGCVCACVCVCVFILCTPFLPWFNPLLGHLPPSPCASPAIALVPDSLASSGVSQYGHPSTYTHTCYPRPAHADMHLRHCLFASTYYVKPLGSREVEYCPLHCLREPSTVGTPRFVHAAILEWYGGTDAFTEYVRGPLQEELVSKQRTGVQISYCMILVAPYLSVALCSIAIWMFWIMVPPFFICASTFGSVRLTCVNAKSGWH